MKNLSILSLVQVVLSLLSAVLISKMSFVGRIGVSTFYSQYAIFKVWWKTAILLFIVQFVSCIACRYRTTWLLPYLCRFYNYLPQADEVQFPFRVLSFLGRMAY